MKKILIISMVLLILVITYNEDKELAAIGFEEEAPVVKSEIVVEDVVYEPAPIITRPEPETEPATEPEVIEVVEISEPKDIRTFRVTAYCSCKKCCGKWSLNRPVDENGNEIVYGAACEVLTSGVSCASPLPFGTNIELSGYGTVIVQDRTADWVVAEHGENIIDIYFSDHETAAQWEVKKMEGEVING